MGKKFKTRMKRIVAFALVAVMVALGLPDNMIVRATTISEVEDKITQDQETIDSITSTISSLTEEQDVLEEEIADLNAEVVNMMTSISLKEDEIAEKESELSDKAAEIEEKQAEIVQAEADYEAAKAQEEEQYAAMVVRIRMMYETNTSMTYLAIILSSSDIGEMINNAEYMEKIYDSDRKLLTEYVAQKNKVQELWDQLVEEEAQLEAEEAQLETDMAELESDRAYLKTLKSELDTQLAELQAQSDDYDSLIASYKSQVSAAKKQLQTDQKALKALQAAAAASTTSSSSSSSSSSGSSGTAASTTYATTSYTSTIDNASGSELGKNIAKYACQFIGNPYVYGGTSLTNGTDCSGFTYSVYKAFGYSLPRTSYEQRSAGVAVSYSEIQPGDIICYSGHVAIYIGGGLIVHASSPTSGIKVSSATYRSIITIRRII